MLQLDKMKPVCLMLIGLLVLGAILCPVAKPKSIHKRSMKYAHAEKALFKDKEGN